VLYKFVVSQYFSICQTLFYLAKRLCRRQKDVGDGKNRDIILGKNTILQLKSYRTIFILG
jgi:hypothetical protein